MALPPFQKDAYKIANDCGEKTNDNKRKTQKLQQRRHTREKHNRTDAPNDGYSDDTFAETRHVKSLMLYYSNHLVCWSKSHAATHEIWRAPIFREKTAWTNIGDDPGIGFDSTFSRLKIPFDVYPA
jgi:hypothetical protein